MGFRVNLVFLPLQWLPSLIKSWAISSGQFHQCAVSMWFDQSPPVAGDNPVCRPARIPGQHEGTMGTAWAASEVLRVCHQSYAASHWSATGKTQVCQRNWVPAQQVSQSYRLNSLGRDEGGGPHMGFPECIDSFLLCRVFQTVLTVSRSDLPLAETVSFSYSVRLCWKCQWNTNVTGFSSYASLLAKLR